MQRSNHETITYPILVRGKDTSGKRFIEETTLRNPGTGTLYFSLNSKAYQGSKLLVVIWLPAIGRMALRCIVTRVDVRPDGPYGVVAKIIRYRSI